MGWGTVGWGLASGWIVIMASGATAVAQPSAAPPGVQPEERPEERYAQVDPSQDRFPETDVPTPLPPEEGPTLPTPSQPTAPLPPEGEQTVYVEQIRVRGSTVFSPAELQAVVAPFQGQSLTLEGLTQAANAVTQLYLNRGYITSQAVVADQVVDDGILEIQVIEGAVEAIQVEGTERLDDYVRSRIALAGLQPLNQFRLEDQLRLLQADPLFEEITASLRAGSGQGQSILVVQVTEAPAFAANLVADNFSPRSVGRERIGAVLQYRNPVGWGDTLLASAYYSSEGGSELYELSYRVPLNPMNGTLQLRAAPNDFRIVDEAFTAPGLNIEGSTEIYEATFRQPLIRTSRQELALSLGFRYRDGETLINEFITDENRTSVVSFGQDYLRRDPQGAWAVRSQFRFGTELFNATDGIEPDGQFFSWLGQLQRLQVLSPDQILLLQADLQLANDSLLGSEQFFVGGGQSVRGYFQNQRSGDNGLRFSIEDRITLVREDDGRVLLQTTPFLDLGYVWAKDADINQFTDDNLLLGTGVGFILNLTPDLTTRLDIGIPLITLDEQAGDRPSRVQVHFNVNYRL